MVRVASHDKKNQQQQISVESFYTTKVSTKEIGMWILSVRINKNYEEGL